jgi:hypothetical protein
VSIASSSCSAPGISSTAKSRRRLPASSSTGSANPRTCCRSTYPSQDINERRRHQPQDRQGPRPHHSAVAAAAGGSSHRMNRRARFRSVAAPFLLIGLVNIPIGPAAGQSEKTPSPLGVEGIKRVLTSHKQWTLYWDLAAVGRPRIGSRTSDRSSSATLEFDARSRRPRLSLQGANAQHVAMAGTVEMKPLRKVRAQFTIPPSLLLRADQVIQ